MFPYDWFISIIIIRKMLVIYPVILTIMSFIGWCWGMSDKSGRRSFYLVCGVSAVCFMRCLSFMISMGYMPFTEIISDLFGNRKQKKITYDYVAYSILCIIFALNTKKIIKARFLVTTLLVCLALFGGMPGAITAMYCISRYGSAVAREVKPNDTTPDGVMVKVANNIMGWFTNSMFSILYASVTASLVGIACVDLIECILVNRCVVVDPPDKYIVRYVAFTPIMINLILPLIIWNPRLCVIKSTWMKILVTFLSPYSITLSHALAFVAIDNHFNHTPEHTVVDSTADNKGDMVDAVDKVVGAKIKAA